LRRILCAPTDVGPAGLSWIVAMPELFRRLPIKTQERWAYRSIRPDRYKVVEGSDGLHIYDMDMSGAQLYHVVEVDDRLIIYDLQTGSPERR
jgi:hypothetical protein